MRWIALLLLLLATPAAAGQFRATWTFPDSGNDGSCTAPAFYPLTLPSVVHVRWVLGAVTAGEDSVAGVAGAAGSLSRQVPAGFYTFRVWVSNVNGISCDSTYTFRVVGPPWKPKAWRME